MAKKTIYVCDRCGKSRFAILSVDLEKRVEGEDDVTETAMIDVCGECLARALKLAMPLVPADKRRAWYEEFRGR